MLSIVQDLFCRSVKNHLVSCPIFRNRAGWLNMEEMWLRPDQLWAISKLSSRLSRPGCPVQLGVWFPFFKKIESFPPKFVGLMSSHPLIAQWVYVSLRYVETAVKKGLQPPFWSCLIFMAWIQAPSPTSFFEENVEIFFPGLFRVQWPSQLSIDGMAGFHSGLTSTKTWTPRCNFKTMHRGMMMQGRSCNQANVRLHPKSFFDAFVWSPHVDFAQLASQ